MCPIACGFILITAILVPIGTDLGDTTNTTWIVGGWTIASSVSFSIAGSLSDTFGRRWTIIVGEVLAIVGSVGQSYRSYRYSQLTWSQDHRGQSKLYSRRCCWIHGHRIRIRHNLRLVRGHFGAFTKQMAVGIPRSCSIDMMLIISSRGTGIGFTETCITVPWSAAGVLIATYLNSDTEAGWRWCYYIGIIYGVISLAGTVAFYFPPARPQYDFDRTRWQEIKEIDYIGCLLYTAGVVLFLVGLTGAGTENPWRSVRVLVPLIVGALSLIGCFAYDFTLAKQPLFPLQLFTQVREYVLLLVIIFVAGMMFHAFAALLPQGTLYMFTNDPVEIGIVALPNGISQLFFGGLLTLVMGKIGHLRLQLIVLLTLQTLFIALLAAVIPDNKPAWMAFQFFAVGPFTLLTLVCYVIAGLNVPLRNLGLASGLIGTFRSAGGSVSVPNRSQIPLTDRLFTVRQRHLYDDFARVGQFTSRTGDCEGWQCSRPDGRRAPIIRPGCYRLQRRHPWSLC